VRRAAIAAVLAACAHPAPAPVYASHVITMEAGAPRAIVSGPFAVTAINPGSDLELALVMRGSDCATATVWFAYSGGGVTVGAGETLCARTDKPRTHAFSGHD
jgi:hypothetical protein